MDTWLERIRQNEAKKAEEVLQKLKGNGSNKTITVSDRIFNALCSIQATNRYPDINAALEDLVDNRYV